MSKQRMLLRAVLPLLGGIALLALSPALVQGQTFELTWGSYGNGDGFFWGPTGVAVDASGNVYVGDGGNHRVQKFDSSGTYLAQWGSQGTGDGQFNEPIDVAIDASGNIYVLERANNRVQKFDANGTFLAKWGSQGAGDGQFSAPEGLTVDASGHVYVADSNNHRMQKFDANGNFISKWGSYGAGDGQFNQPFDVAVDASGHVYVTEYGNHRVQKFDSNGTFITKWGTQGSGDGQFNQAWGVAVDASGHIYVVDNNNHRVQKFDSDGTFITKWGTQGSGDGQFYWPIHVAVDASGHVYMADNWNHRVEKFSQPVPPAPGEIATVAGTGVAGYNGDGIPATAAQLNGPHGLARDGLGNLYIADWINSRVRKVDTSGNISTVAGTETAGYNGDGILATAAQLNGPAGLAIDGQGNLYIADSQNSRVRKVDTSGIITTVAGVGLPFGFSGDGGQATAARLADARDVAVDGLGNLYIADVFNHRVRKVDTSGIITTVAGTGTSGYNGDGIPATTAHLTYPGHVVVDALGNLYIPDTDNHRIRKVDTSGIITTVVGKGVAGFGGDGGPATSAQLNRPQNVDMDALGNLYISDTNNHSIRKVDTNGIITTVAGTGAPGYNGDGIPATTALLSSPVGVVLDGQDIYIAEWGNHRVRKVVEGAGPPPVEVSLPTVTATYNQVLTIPVSISDATGLISAEVFVEYDTALLTVFSAPDSPASNGGTLTDGWSVETNTEAGTGTMEILKIAMATDQSSATGPQTLINLNFTVNDVRTPASSPLTLTRVLLNAGDPANMPVDGRVTLVGNDGSIVSDPLQIIPREDITVTVVDLDEDLDGLGSTDQVTVIATNGLQTETLLLDETAAPGQFTTTISSVFSATSTAAARSGDDILQAKAGDQIVFSFTDALDALGAGPTPLIATTGVIGGVDGTVEITRATQPGDVVYLKVIDADLNLDPGLSETIQVIITSSNGETETVTLTEVDVDDEVFFGNLASAPGAGPGTDDDGTVNGAKGDVLTATYDDVVTAVGDQLDRTDTDQVIDPFGDADGNASVQAFDAAQVLLHVLSPFLTGLEEVQANVDLTPVATGITPFDASLILQKRVGLITLFPVQTAPSDNHPQPVASSPKLAPQTRLLTLEPGDGYLRVVADDRAGLLSGDLLLTGIDRVELSPKLGEYLIAARPVEEGLRLVFAGPRSVDDAGELFRLYGSDLSQAKLQRAELNDGRITALVNGGALALPQVTALRGNWPNPFNPETTLRFDLAQPGEVRLEVFDMLGQKVTTLVAQSLPAGSHQVAWRGVDENGRLLSSGVYLYRLQTGDYTQMRRMLLLK